MSQAAGTTGNAGESGAFVSLENLRPFAKVVFGDGAHEVARCGDGITLAYRPEGKEDWTSLGMQLEEGWPRIGGGIILSQSNALERFVRTHVVKIEGQTRTDGAQEFALEDVSWLVRNTEDLNLIEIRVGSEGDWTTVKIKDIAKEKEKDRAVAALVKVSPDLEMEVSADMVGWAERLGAGAQIMPML